MLKKIYLFFVVLMLAFLFKEGYASIVLINDTQYGAPYSSPKGGGSSTSGGEQSSESSNPQSSSTANDDETSPSTSNNEPQYTSGDETTSEDGDSTDNETYDDCLSTYNWDDCAGEFSTSCLTHQTSGISVSNDKYCTCSTNGENLAICDGTVFANHSLFDFSNYARVQGFAFDFDNMTPVSGYSITAWNYYYNKNPAGFCPYLLHVKMHDSGIWQPEIGLFALSSDYYNNTSDSMNCTSSSIIRFIGDENSGIDCVKPGFDNITRETDVNICVYDMSDYTSYDEYYADVQRLPSCTLKADFRQLARSIYALSGHSDDLSARSQILQDYYIYRPEYAPDDYEISECYVNCATSSAAYNDNADDRITPYCQGWNYVWKCNVLRGKYQNDNNYAQYHVSSLTDNYDIASGNATWVERCKDSDGDKYFAVCGLKTSKKSEAQCNADNATCQGAQGEANCGGDTYCTSCTCPSQYMTLAQWCVANGINPTSCDEDHYEGVHAEDSTTDVCTVDGDPKYLTYQLKNTYSTVCPQQNRTNAIETGSLTAAYLTQKYGSGAIIEQCWDNSENVIKWHISCSSDIYSTLCHTTSGSSVLYCVYGRNENINMKAEADSSYPVQYCQTPAAPGICSQSVTRLDFNGNPVVNQASATLKIYEVSSPEQCYNQYGNAAVAQVCIYPSGVEDPGGAHYNCYYDLSEFIYSTTNKNGAVACAVRHDLSGDYIIHQGQKRWSQCACPSVYSYNQYAGCSAGVLGGNPCVQDLSNVNNSPYLKSKWIAVLGGDTSSALDSDGNIAISSVTLYPYCVCDPSYKYTCDGERETGVGGDCMGKYQSCACQADPLPDNWTDDYFACPEGYGPTGVWKNNGCGKKVWECSNAIGCTSEYKYTCDGPGQKGVDGQGCQDSTGAYVRFKACECMSNYTHTCTGSGQTGVGEACVLGDDTPKYKACECPDGYSKCGSDNTVPASGAVTCTVEPEDGSAYTSYSECSCPSGWSDCNSDGQEGDDSDDNYICRYGGTTLYKYCRCPSGLQDCSNPDDTTSYPPIPSVGNRAYVGVEGEGYQQCKRPNVAWEEYRYEKCKCNEDIFTVCQGNGASGIGVTCQTSNDQYPLYSACVCNSAYTSTCPAEEGKSVAVDQVYDYCQIGDGDKLYKESSCVCNASGWTTCAGNGQVGNGAACLVGESSSTNLPKYTSCDCSNEYRLTCDGAGQYGASATCTNSSGQTFYSACSCNSGWVACTGTQSGVGEPCLENNVEKYEACKCKEDYKYTCLGNAYAFPTDTSDVCVLAGVSYFTSCNCASGYTEKCDGNGEIPTAPNDYCERDGEKYYTACRCSQAYDKTCSSLDHLSPQNPDDYCIDVNDNNTRKYKDCVCDSRYNQTCTGAGEIPPTVTSGVAQSFIYNDGICTYNGINYYTTCKCASGMSKCIGDQSGQGDENSAVCRSGGRKDAQGQWTSEGTKYFQKCTCDPDQYQICSSLGDDGDVSASPIGDNMCKSFTSELDNSSGIYRVISSSVDYTYSSCACPNYYASSAIVTALPAHSLKTPDPSYTFDTSSQHCVGFDKDLSGENKYYDAYQSQVRREDWFACQLPSKAICEGTDDCSGMEGTVQYSAHGCECPPWYSTSCGSFVILDNKFWRESGGLQYYHPNPGWATGHAYTSSSVNSWATQCTKLPTVSGHSSPTRTFSVWGSNLGLYLAHPYKYILSGATSVTACPNITIRDEYAAAQDYFNLHPSANSYNSGSFLGNCYRQVGCIVGSSYNTSCNDSYSCTWTCYGSWKDQVDTCEYRYENACTTDIVSLRNIGAGAVCIYDQQNNIDFIQINYAIYTDNDTYMSDGGWDGNFGRVCANKSVDHNFVYRGPSGSGGSIVEYFTSYSSTNQSTYIDSSGNQQTCSLSGGRRQVKEHYCGTYLNVEKGLATSYVYDASNSSKYYPSCTAKGAGSTSGTNQVLPQCIFTVGQMSSTDGYSSDVSYNNCIADQWVKAHWNDFQYATGPNEGQIVPGWSGETYREINP